MANWRFICRIVAYFDLVLTGIALASVILGVILTAVLFGNEKHGEQLGKEVTDLTAVSVVIWVTLGIYFLACILQFYAAMKLKSATEGGRDPATARGMARTWMIITIIFVVLSSIAGVMKGNLIYVVVVISNVIRGLFLSVVHIFRSQLDHPTQPSGYVVVPMADSVK